KLHNVPAVYVFALNSTLSIGMGPLQDVSEYGANIVPQLRAELGDGCVVIDSTSTFEDRMRQAQRVLAESKPVAICFYPDILSRTVEVDVPRQERRRVVDPREVDRFLTEFRTAADGKRVVIYAGSEAAHDADMPALTTRLAEALRAPVVWSVNGANGVAPDNRYAYGYISFGGNDRAMELWRGLTKDDVVIALGFDAGCTAYKDRQYVTQRPHPNIKFWTTHDGSAMGGGFGLGVGAKIADPSLHTFVFTGDGCWRLFGGALADAANLDLRVFIV